MSDCTYIPGSNEPCLTCPRKITMLYMCHLLQEAASETDPEDVPPQPGPIGQFDASKVTVRPQCQVIGCRNPGTVCDTTTSPRSLFCQRHSVADNLRRLTDGTYFEE